MLNVESKKKIAIIGLGYVGLPLAFLFINNGFEVIGIDIDENKIKKINTFNSYLPEIRNDELKKAILDQTFKVSSNYDLMNEVNAIILCIPTPLSVTAEPDLSYLINAADCLVPRLKKGQLIVLESSTYPGTTKDVLQPILEKSGFQIGKDLYLSYSPERMDPGSKDHSIKDIPKVVSGVTEECLTHVVDLYSKVFNHVVIASSTEIAEMSKLLENSYRFINISFINEISILCDLLKINVWEVIQTASTKPFGFTPFYPGPGIGGHCIPVDPLYLQWKACQVGGNSKFIDAAIRINKLISDHIVLQITKVLSDVKKKKILICGVTYKKDINDLRESHAIPIIESLLQKGANISYFDPFVDELLIFDKKLTSIKLTEDALKIFDCVVILTDHSSLPIKKILEYSKIVYDTRNASNGIKGNAKVFHLGGGML
ncbi:nucleotide sugar dehydrogenase [Bacillus methanolicus]|uniref:nucleotide sugar dehydrogenase n=1 Tax=Bacillus methanolicus TaxID=1471 RepID=UPI00025F1DC8|nr:nucleotide sugar dehydrogenase [Bacillus methanolicus]EIJ77734.1 UDP-glucose:GDP-mannose dehydrogenase [Bacillus methanolicus MGA3]